MNEELGRIGQKRYSGVFYEEFLPELCGIKGVRAYEEMSENDDVIGAILFAIKMLIRQATWGVEAAGSEKLDLEAAEFVETCLDDMQSTWTDTVSEILSFLTYGWSVHELVYKRRMGQQKDPRLDSKFDDGLIGWQKLPIRCQESLYEWQYDEHDNLKAFVQMPAPTFQTITIPIDKLLLFRTESRKDNRTLRHIRLLCRRVKIDLPSLTWTQCHPPYKSRASILAVMSSSCSLVGRFCTRSLSRIISTPAALSSSSTMPIL